MACSTRLISSLIEGSESEARRQLCPLRHVLYPGAIGSDERRIRRILIDLDVAFSPAEMDRPGYRLHRLRGDRRDVWSVRVSGNWRVVFRFADGEAVDVDLIDYH